MKNDEANEAYSKWLAILKSLPYDKALDIAARTIALWYIKATNKKKIDTSYLCFEDEIPF